MKMTPSKRFAVRTALVTGTTLATIIGAQALASLDETAFSQTPPAIMSPAESSVQSVGGIAASGIAAFTGTSGTAAAAPDIVILRHAGQVASVESAAPQISVQQAGTSITSPQPVVIQPPSPVQVAAPQPVQVAAPQPAQQQQSAPRPVARTRSSR